MLCRLLTCSLLLPTWLLAQAGDSPQNPTDPASAFAIWAATNSIQLPAPGRASAAWAPTKPDLTRLDALLADRRVILLGSSDRHRAQGFNYQALLLRHLLTRGLTHVATEMGRHDARRIERFLATGDRSHLDTVTAYGYSAVARTDDQPRDPLARQRRRQLEQLRFLIPAGRKLRWSGYDIDDLPIVGYEEIERELASGADSAPVAAALQRLERGRRETAGEEARRLTKLAAHLDRHRDELTAALGAERLEQIIGDVQCTAATVSFRGTVARSATSPGDRRAAFAARESAMIRQLDALLDQLGPDDRLLVIGHAMHLGKDTSSLFFGQMDGARMPMWPSLGNHLSQRLGPRALMIWMTFGAGNLPGSVESLLAREGENLLLPLDSSDRRARYLDHERLFSINSGPAGGHLARLADAILFVK